MAKKERKEGSVDKNAILHMVNMDEWIKLEPPHGKHRAEHWLRSARKERDEAKSDWSYWGKDTDVAVASALYAMYYRLERGQVMFAPPPLREGMLMDANATLVEWANQLLADHRQSFTRCRHWVRAEGNLIPSKADHPRCELETKFMTTHWVCDRCGQDRYAGVVIR